jgi:hypothetical protein
MSAFRGKADKTELEINKKRDPDCDPDINFYKKED